MYQFVALQYRMGKITAEQVWGFTPAWITADEAEKIIVEALGGQNGA